MNINFIINEYLIAWNILFTKSITKNLRDSKQKLWDAFRDEYNKAFSEKEAIISENKNYIPNNDNLYNAIIEKEDFKILKKDADKTRVNIMKLWDKNIKDINRFIKRVIKINIADYLCFIINKDFDICEISKISKKNGYIIIGKNQLNENEFLVNLIHEILNKEVAIIPKDNIGIRASILELAILNEFATTLNGKSCYYKGKEELYYLKKQIYPYWLMYLGIEKDNMVEYMKRDTIFFDEDKVDYNYELKSMNIEEFIEFVINNKKTIVKVMRLADTEEII